MSKICEFTELEREWCSHCQKRAISFDGAMASAALDDIFSIGTRPPRVVTFFAAFNGSCGECGDRVYEGDLVGYVGDDSLLHCEECLNEAMRP